MSRLMTSSFSLQLSKTIVSSLSDETLMDETTTITTNPILKDTITLCETLFNQLNAKFQEFFSALPLHHHDNLPGPLPPPDSRLFSLVENLSLILRRSLVALTLPFSDQEFLINKCRFILSILKSFLSVDITHNQLQLSDSYRPFLCTVLEVGPISCLIESGTFFKYS